MRCAKYLFYLLSLTSLGACTDSSYQTQDSGSNYFKLYRFDPVEQKGTFNNVLLENLTTIHELAGAYAQFIFEPSDQGSGIQGKSPELSYLQNREGVWIPQNMLSLEVASLYYQFQNLYYFDKKLGFESLYQLPRKVAIRTRMVDPNSKGLIQNNAFYDIHRKMFFFLSSGEKDMQLPLNAGVVAHEHFHSLFDRLVLDHMKVSEMAQNFIAVHTEADSSYTDDSKNNPDPKQEILEQKILQNYNFIFLRGLNEGLADFWGWLYTNDPYFVGRSLSKSIELRSLTSKPEMSWMKAMPILVYLERIQKKDPQEKSGVSSENAVAMAYYLGTQLARSLVILQLDILQVSPDILASKEKMAGYLLKFLEKWGLTLQARVDQKEVIDGATFVTEFLQFLKEQDLELFEKMQKIEAEKNKKLPPEKND